jgi:hypothetical protein
MLAKRRNNLETSDVESCLDISQEEDQSISLATILEVEERNSCNHGFHESTIWHYKLTWLHNF